MRRKKSFKNKNVCFFSASPENGMARKKEGCVSSFPPSAATKCSSPARSTVPPTPPSCAPSPGGAILYLEFKGRLEDKQRNFRPVNMDWVLLYENSADREVNSSWLRK
ncbi:uncharacterized protein LOC144199524 [Stigmatopora nigra]